MLPTQGEKATRYIIHTGYTEYRISPVNACTYCLKQNYQFQHGNHYLKTSSKMLQNYSSVDRLLHTAGPLTMKLLGPYKSYMCT